MQEEWRDVVGYEGIYQISNFGQVKRICSGTGTIVGTVLKCGVARGGYKRVLLYKGSHASRKRFMVHRLVYLAFHGSIPEGCEINHKDGDKQNIHADNLECLTKKAHTEHTRIVLGRFPANRGTANGQHLLTPDDVRDIRALYQAGGHTYKSIAALYGVEYGCIGAIIRRENWAHVE